MLKIIHLIRHGHHALLGRILCGRMSGVELDDLGRSQMAQCAELLAPSPSVIQSSPRRRALQSASILAELFGLAVEIVPALDELDCGDWTGKRFSDLEGDSRWSAWNTQRATNRPPGGESMHALQQRVINHLEQMRSDHMTGTVAIVSHAEPIRAALLHYCGMPLDAFPAISVDPASVSTLSLDRSGIRTAKINQQVPA